MPVNIWKERGSRYYRYAYYFNPGDKRVTGSTRRADKVNAWNEANRIFKEAQAERDGLLAPKSQREAATKNLAELVEKFETFLINRRRNSRHVFQVQSTLLRMIKECGWKTLRDVTKEGFEEWRGKLNLSGKTLNEYLSRANSFMKWLVQNGRIAVNPLQHVSRNSMREEKRERRALSEEELQRLRAVSGKRWVVYLIAVCTGLRRNELKQLQWRDLFLDEPEPYLKARAATTKNGKEAALPLVVEAVEALKAHKDESASPTDLVFPKLVPEMELFRKHLALAGIPYQDAAGRFADFHALRVVTATTMARRDVPLPLAMLHMRHSDPRLTAKVYTDAGRLPHGETIRKIQFVGESPVKNTVLKSCLESPAASNPDKHDNAAKSLESPTIKAPSAICREVSNPAKLGKNAPVRNRT